VDVNDHPFYRPLWRRIAVVLATAIWFGFELWTSNDGMWLVIGAAFFGYACFALLINYKDNSKP
jgi:hypothetical protein